MKNILITIVAMSLLLFSLSTWSASTKEEIKALSAQVEAMQKDLAEIKTLLKAGTRIQPKKPAAPAFKAQVVSIGDSPYMGKVDAPVTLVEYSDYQCPFCSRHYREVLPEFVKEYIDTGKLKYVMKELPLPTIHINAMNAANAALCAHDQDKYFEMHNVMFENQRDLSKDNLKALASNIGLDTGSFNECIDTEQHKDQIKEDIASSKIYGMTGTPGFAWGLTDPDDPDKVKMMKVVKGSVGFSFYKRQIDPILKSVK